ncbi:MAG: hypothetical protein ABWZ76_05110, partial [Acidimicrobiales bacterium]
RAASSDTRLPPPGQPTRPRRSTSARRCPTESPPRTRPGCRTTLGGAGGTLGDALRGTDLRLEVPASALDVLEQLMREPAAVLVVDLGSPTRAG